MDVREKRVKSDDVDELDRISALPLHLREYILEFLPIKDAMRTSIFSSSWRYCWIGMRGFDLKDMGLDRSADVEVFRKTVDRILLLNTCAIHFFNFSFPRTGNYLDVNLSDWFLVLSKKRIHSILANASTTRNQIPLPHSLFHCGDLKSLKLYHFKITPPSNLLGFNNLVELVISNCTIPSDILGGLISHCPLLQYLFLAYICTRYRDQRQTLVINAANLKTFFIKGDLFGTIIFQNVPKLSHASFTGPNFADLEQERSYISWDFICSFSGMRALQFHILLFEPVIGKWPRCFPMRFENLRALALYGVNTCVEDDLRVVLCFLRSSPSLEHLKLEFGNKKTAWLPEPNMSIEEALQLLEAEMRESCKLSNVLRIDFLRIGWLRPEIMLVKVLLSGCSNLKSLRIFLDERQHREDFLKQMSREFEELPHKNKLFYL